MDTQNLLITKYVGSKKFLGSKHVGIIKLWVHKSYVGNQYFEVFKFVGTQNCVVLRNIWLSHIYETLNFCTRRYSTCLYLIFVGAKIVDIHDVVTQRCGYS